MTRNVLVTGSGGLSTRRLGGISSARGADVLNVDAVNYAGNL